MATLEVYDACIGQLNKVNFKWQLNTCKKRDIETNACLVVSEGASDRDIKRLELYALTIKALYAGALLLPFVSLIGYQCLARFMKAKQGKFDDRTFVVSQFLTIYATLYVCLTPFLLAVHNEILNKVYIDGQLKSNETFKMQSAAIWIIHSNMFRIMLLFFFRMMTIDMSLFQFIDWLLEQFEEDEETESDMDKEIKEFEKLQEELKTASGDRLKEIKKKMLDHALSKSNSAKTSA